MANPQPEPYVKFSKELFDAILRSPLDGTHLEVVLAVIRRTYGDYGKRSAPLSLSLVSRILGKRRTRHWISRCIDELVSEGVLTIVKPQGTRTPRVLALNKDYEKWGRFSAETVPPDETVTPHETVTPEETLRHDEGFVQEDSGFRPVGLQSPSTRNPAERETVPPDETIEDKRDIEETPPHKGPPHDEAAAGNPPDPFDDLWSLLPKQNGSRELSRYRFADLSADEQGRCLAAARHVREYLDGGGSVKYLPANENFIGGQKSRYQMWVEGIPPRYRSDNGSAGARATSGVTDPEWQSQLQEAYSDD